MADRLAHLAWMQHREHVAVNADMIAKWERGVKGVSTRYRELLCRLFGVTADQLGLKTGPPSAAARTVPPGADESLVGMLDNAAHLLDQLGAAGTALAPHMLHAWKDAVTTRRTMLGLLDPAATDPVGHACAATADIADLEHLADRYQALYETADPAALMTPVAAHLRMTADALRRNPAPEERRRLLRNQPRSPSSPATWPPMTLATPCPAAPTTPSPWTPPAKPATTTSPPAPMATPPNSRPQKE